MDFSKHPCFNAKARHEHGRVHLPVAPRCNIKCGFCNRKYDCANETRPGVTSSVLTPEQSLLWLERIMKLQKNIAVVGIAGPGDPFANPEETMRTLRLVRKKYPEMLLCVATNGLNVAPFVQELAELQVSHVTITICSPEAATGAKIYQWVADGKIIHRGEEGATLLLSRQLQAVSLLSAAGIMVKVNMIVVPGVNDHQVEELAKTVSGHGAKLLNLMPLYPVAETAFAAIKEPDCAQIEALRTQAEQYLPQMKHCMRCRADAVGLIGEETAKEIAMELKEAQKIAVSEKPYVAVASREGALVNLHLGEAPFLWIFKQDGNDFVPLERRGTPPRGLGNGRWLEMAKIMEDCRVLLCSGVGDNPRKVLAQFGVAVVEMEGLIEDALVSVYEGTEIRSPKRSLGCGKNCSGGGNGCG